MISFLNSGILFLSSAIVIPVLIYLFARKKPKQIIFSSIRFIKASQQQQKKKINLKNLLLLLLRMMIILSVILAISRPALKLPFLEKGDQHPKTAIVIIIDNSYSMNYLADTQTELEKAKEIALKINEMLAADDEIILLTLDNSWNQINSNLHLGRFDPDLITNIKVTSKHKPLTVIIEEAEQKLKDTQLPNQEIIIITDMQQVELPEKISIPTFFVPASSNKERNNISLQKCSIYNEIVEKGNAKKLNFEIVNHAKLKQQDVIYRLFLDGNTVSEKATDLEPEQRKNTSFEIDVQNKGWHSGYVEVKNERQTFDNRCYFSFYHNPAARIAFVSDLTEIPITLASLLEIYTNEPDNIKFIDDQQLSVENLNEFDNIIFYKKTFSAKISFVLDNIKAYLLIADKNLSEDWKSYITREYQISFSEYMLSSQTNILSNYNQYHPITRHLKNISDVEVNDFWQTSTSNSALLQSEENALALAQDRKCLWLFDIDSRQNPFLVNAAFPVFAYNTLVYLANKTEMSTLLVGDKINATQLILPNGQTIQTSNNRYYALTAGIYKTPERTYAVNLDFIESNYSRMRDPQQKNIIFTENWQQQILHSRYGFELWKYLLLLALLLFAVEIVIVKREESR